jgi:hypothetical protein
MYTINRAYERGVSWYIGSGPPESQEGACESLKGHIALTIDVLFWFLICIGIFNYFLTYLEKIILKNSHLDFDEILPVDLKSSILREVSVCPCGHKAVLFRLATFLLETQTIKQIIQNIPGYRCWS